MERPGIAGTYFASLVAIIFVLAGGLAYAQASYPQRQASYMLAAATQDQAPAAHSEAAVRGSFPVLLVKSIDSKKAKVGDTVVCQSWATLHAQNGLMIPSRSKIIGHVTRAQARSKGDPQSSLAIVFDKIEVAKGEAIPIKGVLQAVGPSVGDTGPQTGPATGDTMGSGAHSGGSPFTAPPPQAGTYGGYDKSKVTPLLNKDTKGVLGYKNLEMDDNHVITSTGKEVKLEDGTQIMIRAE